ncbi:MAG: E3 ubiquitin-protein ligase bre1 [Pycnora praestabilis]|nr:MAG: E3 ubiquitin-protein ligase bre1 [Pycnora praestabilis]
MEDRKRPAHYDHDDGGPPAKKQATSVNGASKNHSDSDMPWKDDLERYQKDAIYRQMQEYKRERNTLEGKLSEMAKKSAYHDDHLRIIDAWFKQVIDEVRLLAGGSKNADHTLCNGDSTSFASSLMFVNNEKFEEHLQSRSQDIQSTISQLFTKLPQASPDVVELQSRLANLLAAEKSHIAELDRARAEKEQLEDRLENASLRYMVAEKKLDRSKSATVAKLEKQAILGGGNDSGSGIGGGGGGGEGSGKVKSEGPGGPNGVAEGGEVIADAESERREAIAVSQKRQEQIQKLEAENEKLTGEVTTWTVKMSRLSDEDYSRTDLFKTLKSQHEDVIKRVNDLKATNDKLREEAEKLQAERTAYQLQLENESKIAISEAESHLARAESDLARVRTHRDEVLADNTMRKAALDQKRTTSDRIQELAAAKDGRITALESEIERLRSEAGQPISASDSQAQYYSLSIEELQAKCLSTDQRYTMLSSELKSAEAAYRKAVATTNKSVADLGLQEERISRLIAEKSKADQKYFTTMKALEAAQGEAKTLKVQNYKSSEIVTSLKDAETHTRLAVVNLEKQLEASKDALNTSTNQLRSSQQHVSEHKSSIEGLKAQITELNHSLRAKDNSLTSVSKSYRDAEVELEQLKVRLEETKKGLESWKTKGLGNQSGEYEMLRVSIPF